MASSNRETLVLRHRTDRLIPERGDSSRLKKIRREKVLEVKAELRIMARSAVRRPAVAPSSSVTADRDRRSLIEELWDSYDMNHSWYLKVIDAYLLYCGATGILLFLYCALVGTFPFNAFLGGFIACVGNFVLTGTSI